METNEQLNENTQNLSSAKDSKKELKEQKKEELRARIVELIEAKGLTNTSFADLIEESRSKISHIVNSRNGASFAIVEKIIDHFPEVNLEWLLKGIGNMFVDGYKSLRSSTKAQASQQELFLENKESNQIVTNQEQNSTSQSQPINQQVNPNQNQNTNFANNFAPNFNNNFGNCIDNQNTFTCNNIQQGFVNNQPVNIMWINSNQFIMLFPNNTFKIYNAC